MKASVLDRRELLLDADGVGIVWVEISFLRATRLSLLPSLAVGYRRSSEIQGTALGKCLRAWTYIYIYTCIGPYLRVSQSSGAV